MDRIYDNLYSAQLARKQARLWCDDLLALSARGEAVDPARLAEARSEWSTYHRMVYRELDVLVELQRRNERT